MRVWRFREEGLKFRASDTWNSHCFLVLGLRRSMRIQLFKSFLVDPSFEKAKC